MYPYKHQTIDLQWARLAAIETPETGTGHLLSSSKGNIAKVAKFTNEQYTTSNQSTAGHVDLWGLCQLLVLLISEFRYYYSINATLSHYSIIAKVALVHNWTNGACYSY